MSTDLIHTIHMAHYALQRGINGNKTELTAAAITAQKILADAIDNYNEENLKAANEEKFDDENPDYIKASPEEI